jgi:hypothetical protein
VKFFIVVPEGEPVPEINDFIFYGYVARLFPEWVNFRLSELN